MPNAPQSNSFFTKNSFLSVGVVGVLVGAVAGGAVWATKMEMHLQNANDRLDGIETALKLHGEGRWMLKHERMRNNAFNEAFRLWLVHVEHELGVELPPFEAPDPSFVTGE